MNLGFDIFALYDTSTAEKYIKIGSQGILAFETESEAKAAITRYKDTGYAKCRFLSDSEMQKVKEMHDALVLCREMISCPECGPAVAHGPREKIALEAINDALKKVEG